MLYITIGEWGRTCIYNGQCSGVFIATWEEFCLSNLNKKIILKSHIYFTLMDQQVGGGVGTCLVCFVLIVGWLHANTCILPDQK